jgi:Fur family peroxide stress response transcriptional regulator
MNNMSMFHREPARLRGEDADDRRALEEAGWRYTRQRAAVLAYLRTACGHPTAEQVFAAVRQRLPNISLATVYKALEALVDARLANRIAGDHGPTRYDGRSEPHYHLRCQHSGEVLDLPLPYDPTLLDKLNPQLMEMLRQQGFEIMEHRLELVGRFVCPDKPY